MLYHSFLCLKAIKIVCISSLPLISKYSVIDYSSLRTNYSEVAVVELKTNSRHYHNPKHPSSSELNENFQNLLGYRNHLIVGLLVLLVSTSVYNYQRIKFYKRYIRKRNLEYRRLRESVKFYKNLPNLNIIDDSQVLGNDSLNDRQKEIVLQMLKGFTNAEIAEKLFIAETTVKYHIKNIYKIYDVKNRSQLYKKFAVKAETVSQ